VKWRGQGYDACTWEPDGSGPLMQPERLPLHLQLWARQRRALERAGEAGRAAAAAAEARAQQQGVPVVGGLWRGGGGSLGRLRY
jgi:hypothetical protein